MSDRTHEENATGGRKRKKKRSRAQMAKKLARHRDHGSELAPDAYNYAIQILDLIRAGSQSVDEKSMLAKNVYAETVGLEENYARSQVGSRVLDSLLVYADLHSIKRLYEALATNLRPLSNDKFASHVLEKILLVCADRGSREPEVEKSKPIGDNDRDNVDAASDALVYNDIVIKLGQYWINNAEEFVFETYASHLVRRTIECLAGLIPVTQKEVQEQLSQLPRRPVTPKYKELLLDSCNRFLKWPQLLEFGQDSLTSGFLQSILYSTKDAAPSLTDAFVQKITGQCWKGQETEIFENEYALRLIEVCLAVATPERFNEIYRSYFAGRLKDLSTKPVANFTVQRLLEHCPTKEEFEEIYEELSLHLSAILESGNTGVLHAIGAACLRLRTKQGAWAKSLDTLLQSPSNPTSAESQPDFLTCLVTLKTREEVEKFVKRSGGSVSSSSSLLTIPTLSIKLHGSLMVQTILKFNKPIKLVESLLNTNTENLVALFNDPRGSRILDAFMESKFIGEKSREKLSKKLKGYWAELAQSVHGSRCLERFWTWARTNQRVLIMTELAAAGKSLQSSKPGRILSAKLNVPLFARSKTDWCKLEEKSEKTKDIFSEIIGPQQLETTKS